MTVRLNAPNVGGQLAAITLATAVTATGLFGGKVPVDTLMRRGRPDQVQVAQAPDFTPEERRLYDEMYRAHSYGG